MIERGEGYFLVTASAAGLLNIVESPPYGVTKHAAVAIAEWLRIAYGRQGLRVSCLCPQSVATAMTAQGTGSAGLDGVLTTEQVARAFLVSSTTAGQRISRAKSKIRGARIPFRVPGADELPCSRSRRR